MSESSEENCAICLLELDDTTSNKKLTCEHKFHKECIITWFKIQAICPICRGGIVVMYSDDTDTEFNYDEEQGRLIISTRVQKRIRKQQLESRLQDLQQTRINTIIILIIFTLLVITLIILTVYISFLIDTDALTLNDGIAILIPIYLCVLLLISLFLCKIIENCKLVFNPVQIRLLRGVIRELALP